MSDGDDRLPAWTSAWLSGLDAGQLQSVIEMPGKELTDILSGARAGKDTEMEALQRLDARPRVISIADRMRAKAARAVDPEPVVGVALVR